MVSHEPPSFIKNVIQVNNSDGDDPSGVDRGGAPNFGRFVVEHIDSFQGQTGSAAKTYRDYDEAIKDSLDNARYMRNDCGVMECIEARQRACALLDWTLVPEDETSQDQKALCEELTKILMKIPRFTEYRFNLLHAIWYGKYGIQHRYAWQNVGGRKRVMPSRLRENVGWLPINGDKLVFRFRSHEAQPHQLPYQVGIRVGAGHKAGDLIDGYWKVESTDRGMAYFPSEYERRVLSIHKHTIEDGAYEDALSAGSIHGVGVRSRIYWDWVQKQESLGMMIEYLERSAGGIRLWKYPEGNDEAKKAAERSAKNASGGGYNDLLVPVPMGEDGYSYGVEVIEPGMGGIDAIQRLITDYFGHRAKRYILGQVLSTEAQATGMGSGLAELHMDSFLQIIKYDAVNLEETITEDLVRNVQIWNFPQSRNIDIRFQLVTEDSNTKEKLEAYHSAWEMGARIREADVMETIGAAIPNENDRVLENPQIKQAEMMGQMMGGQGGGMFGGPGPGSMESPAKQELAQQIDEHVDTVDESGPSQPEASEQSEKYSRQSQDVRNLDLTANVSTLRKIAEDLIAGTAIDREMVRDIQIVGSATNLSRFTESSDIDLHLIVDPPEGIRDIIMDYLRNVAANWNLKHHITIGGHPVELFAEEISEPAVSDGRFSLVTGEWVSEPGKRTADCQKSKIQRQADKLERIVELAIQEGRHKELQSLLTRFRQARRQGLKQVGEDSIANCVYKELRNRGVLQKLKQVEIDSYDESLSYARDPERYRYVLRDDDLRNAIQVAAAETEADPSEAQKASGNFRKGKFHLHGMEVAIETPRGATRSGKNRLGVEWSIEMPAHYGYIRRTEGRDGDHVDVFIGPHPESEIVYVVDQQSQSGRFDEHKVVLGCQSLRSARALYLSSYTKGWTGLKSITPMTIWQFREWLKSGNQKRPVEGQVSKYAKWKELK